MKKIAITVLIAIQIMNFSCESNEPVLMDDAISLSVIDAAVGETYLNVNIANPYHTKEFVIERNGRRVISVPASSSEIAITDTGLIENTTYKYI
ncbi:MAG: hypothetical protein M0P71_14125, partial [Melioribacteraceae bacterium]|nr:hypothetical protein [Melioribacteraceae bacterium]